MAFCGLDSGTITPILTFLPRYMSTKFLNIYTSYRLYGRTDIFQICTECKSFRQIYKYIRP